MIKAPIRANQCLCICLFNVDVPDTSSMLALMCTQKRIWCLGAQAKCRIHRYEGCNMSCTFNTTRHVHTLNKSTNPPTNMHGSWLLWLVQSAPHRVFFAHGIAQRWVANPCRAFIWQGHVVRRSLLINSINQTKTAQHPK